MALAEKRRGSSRMREIQIAQGEEVLDFIEGSLREVEFIQHHVKLGVLPSETAAPRFRELLEQNPHWADAVQRYGKSPKHLVRILVALYPDKFLSHSNLYRLTTAVNLGENRASRRVNALAKFVEEEELSDRVTVRERLEALGLMTDFEVTSRVYKFSKNPKETVQELEDLFRKEENPFLKSSYQKALGRMREAINLRISAFKPEFQPRPYQSLAVLQGLDAGLDKTTIGIFDEMRTGKTMIALARIEYIGAKKALVIVPSNGKKQWEKRIEEYYNDRPETVIVEGNLKDRSRILDEAADPSTKFTIVGWDLLVVGNGHTKPRNYQDKNFVSPLFEDLLDCGFDTVIFDEFHMANNYRLNTQRSKAVRRLSESKNLKHTMILTGTPVDRSRDLDLAAHLIDRESYPAAESFSSSLRENPRMMHNALITKVVRRKAEEVLKLPPTEEYTVNVDLNPTQRFLYDCIHKLDDTHPFSKLSNLQAAILHTGLVKNIPALLPEKVMDRKMQEAYIAWKKVIQKQPQTKFDSDFLVQKGFSDLYISALVHLRGGISELVSRSTASQIPEVWKGESTPAKFVAIQERIIRSIDEGDKVLVFSSFFAEGVTRSIFDEGKENEHYISLVQFLRNEFGTANVLILDGMSKTESTLMLPDGSLTTEREEVIQKWQNDPKCKIMVGHMKVSAHGNDLSVDLPEISGISVIRESRPFSLPLHQQTHHRVLSDKQKKPVRFFDIEANNTIDADKKILLDEKAEKAGMLLDAIDLTDGERKILDDNVEQSDGFLARAIRSPRQNVTMIFGAMIGKSTEEVKTMLDENFTQSQSVGEYLSKWYEEVYKGGYAGYTAEMIKQVIEGLHKRGGILLDRIADFGSGPLVLARTLQQPVKSLDISSDMLQTGKKKLLDEGIDIPDSFLVEGSLSNIPKSAFPDNSFDIGVCSLALDCTQKGEERIAALTGMKETLSDGGYLIVTIPDSEMDANAFHDFLEGAQELGLTDELSLSGFIKGENSGGTIFGTWMFILKNTGKVRDQIDENKFTFPFEKDQSTSKIREERRLLTLTRSRAQKNPEVERFVVTAPEKNQSSQKWAVRGEVKELLEDTLLRQFLDLPDETLAELGFKRETIIHAGKEQIRLTRI